MSILYLSFLSHSFRLKSGKCLIEKYSNNASKPSPSGLAAIIPTITGLFSDNYATLDILYVMPSKE